MNNENTLAKKLTRFVNFIFCLFFRYRQVATIKPQKISEDGFDEIVKQYVELTEKSKEQINIAARGSNTTSSSSKVNLFFKF